MSYGIDTVKVGFQVTPIQIDFDHWRKIHDATIVNQEEIKVKDFYLRRLKTQNNSFVTLKYVQKDYQGCVANKLFVEFSLPKLILGCNYKDISDIENSLNQTNAIIAEIEGLPQLPDIRDAELFRIDLCANLQVGENVTDYILALGKAHKSRRKTTCYSNTGAVFKSSEISESFYDKQAECKHNEARGILRFEISIRKKRKIRSCFNMKHSTLRNITKDVIYMYLITELEKFSLDKPILSDRSKLVSILSNIYKKQKAYKLAGYWEDRQKNTKEQLIAHGTTPRMIREYEKQLAQAGISIHGNMGKEELPALTPLLDKDAVMNEGEQKWLRTPSVTRDKFISLLDEFPSS